MLAEFRYTNKGKKKVSNRVVFVTEMDETYCCGIDLTEFMDDAESALELISELEDVEKQCEGMDEEKKATIRVACWQDMDVKHNYRRFLVSNMDNEE